MLNSICPILNAGTKRINEIYNAPLDVYFWLTWYQFDHQSNTSNKSNSKNCKALIVCLPLLYLQWIILCSVSWSSSSSMNIIALQLTASLSSIISLTLRFWVFWKCAFQMNTMPYLCLFYVTDPKLLTRFFIYWSLQNKCKFIFVVSFQLNVITTNTNI